MTVANGQAVNETVTNAAYVSKTDTSASNVVVGIVALNNGSSGDTTTNLQQTLSDATNKLYSTQLIAASGAIALDLKKQSQIIPVAGDAGAQVMAALPFGSDTWTNGQKVILIGTDDTNTVRINHNDVSNGVVLNGDIILKKYMIIELLYLTVLGRWIEVRRNA